MAKHGIRARVRYKFDNFIAKGGSSIFISLVVVSIATLALIGVLRGGLYLVWPDGADGERMPRDPMAVGAAPDPDAKERTWGEYARHVYIIFLEMTDPGNMNQDVHSSAVFKVPAVLAGLSGVVLLSILIAFITTALDQKLAELRKGHSDVLEEGHTVVLGWNNERIVEVLKELIIANESEDDACVVILSEEEKETMDDFLAVHLPGASRQTTRIQTRSGKVSAPVNLEKIAITRCKSVIVLANCMDVAPDDEKASSDAKVIKTVLAVLATKPADIELNIVAEIFQERNREIVQNMAPSEVTTVDTVDILAKILVQTSRSIGLSVVYSEILSFDGCEMYFAEGEWGGISFVRLAFHFPDGVPLGIRRRDGSIRLNPPVDVVMEDDDEILIVAEDDSTIDFKASPVVEPRALPFRYEKSEQRVERELILGWHPKVDIILEQYSDYLLDGSTIDVMVRQVTPYIRAHIAECQSRMPGIRVSLTESDPMQVQNLLDVEPFNYDNIIILSQSVNETDPERTDSETIIILLLLRSIFADHQEEAANTKLITEILDSENQELVARAGVNDFIISTQLVSMLLGQISESQDIKKVYDDLFQEAGSEIYLKPVHLYLERDQFPLQANFADMMRLAQQRNEVCLGVKIKAYERDLRKNFGVKLNPAKDQVFDMLPDDCLVVLSEDET